MIHWEIRLSGIVQGVGMRPHVYAVALSHGIHGSVQNTPEGLLIHAEGDEAQLEDFLKNLQATLPPLARVDELKVNPVDVMGYDSFAIVSSLLSGGSTAGISPDIALCPACLSEMNDPQNRRYRYAFTNCTNCGPRYSISKSLPYDRSNTSMVTFEMCDACQTEYEDPTDRRYHAQPISCYACGPTLTYIENGEAYEGEQALIRSLEAFKTGKIVAVKGLGGFHLMCDANNEKSVQLLRKRKRRPAKPFAVMFPSMDAICDAAFISNAEVNLIDSKERPVVLVKSKANTIASSVAPGIDRIGVFLPYTPLHYRMFDLIDFPLVATSANLSDEPIIQTSEALHAKLSDLFDAVLTHDRDIVNACDDTVMQVQGDRPLMLRLARGFAPTMITLPFYTDKKILAVGANQKNAIALAFENKVILSPHIGDLGSVEAFEYFGRTLETFKAFYDFEPDVIVCDKHPGYETSKWAKRQNKKIVEVQHHYAHMLACMAEYDIHEKVLGFAFDGTGYGDDKTIWGGEVFLGDSSSYERVFFLKPFRLLGGEKAVREPRRVALGVLFETYSLDAVLSLDSPTVKAFAKDEIIMLHAAWQKALNAPLTSSMGRLFDAVASLAGITQVVSYEGESGLLLEAVVDFADVEPFGYILEAGKVDVSPMIEAIVDNHLSAGEIASRFIVTLVEIMAAIATQYKEKVILSGGVFQNKTLLEQVTKRFDEEGIDYYLSSKFPVNDSAIALGQIWYALHRG